MRRRRGALVVAGAVVLTVAAGGQAYAKKGFGDDDGETPPGTGGGRQGDTLTAGAAGISYTRSGGGGGNKVAPLTAAGNWTPPPCYYAPKYTPQELEDTLVPIWQAESTGHEWDLSQKKKYQDGEPYKDFNKDKAGKGFWWASYVTPGFEGDPGSLACDQEIFWVDKGDPPPANIPQAITPEILAQLAYGEIRVPGTEVELAPGGESKVNLPTWVWLEKAKFTPVSVTARVDALGVEATTTAEPVSLRIEPGTADARTLPASGTCPIRDDGSIGEPYAPGKADRTPPCGVTYLRSSREGSFPLRATVTWKVHWTGTGVNGEQPLPEGSFGAEQDVVVREVQSVNR
ncbi:hypothetical protein [Streptomyces sp. AM 3-1-1]|uniref:hypothetical protein n=1 Tax=Streptomyces sp. AM 3-1-1 TaxID=3028711 RepID=UPI0023B9AC6A|nr:hypothetical protein [Streptomyces sp. AM 3-1-1]WEH29535.1 hypothetical protein P0D76_20670 [Streptomyces sp. AM 3-1-1]